jgi:hypothetical protein
MDHLRRTLGLALLWAVAFPAAGAAAQTPEAGAATAVELSAPAVPTDAEMIETLVAIRMQGDLEALQRFRPGYPFWQHVFLLRDGSIVYGSNDDGRLLASFPVRGDWSRQANWSDEDLGPALLMGVVLPGRLTDRRDRVAALLEPLTGPVIHNPTRGEFLLPNVERYGGFVEEWATIYERFGVPAEIGLAQAIVESGLRGDVKSEARAVGFCQWLPGNWERLQRLTPHTIEVANQTTQAAYCAAYLTVLGTKYGSFLPALSEHHAGGANVGRTVINGGRLGADGTRERYLLGADLARDLRALSPRTFRSVVGSYGPRSYRYAEMVFGNAATVQHIRETTPQESIHAMRVPRATSLEQIVQTSGLSASEVKRFNPALVRRVPRGATLYLPRPLEALGTDVTFWHRPAPASFQATLADFIRLDVTLEDWESDQFENVLEDFRRRFQETRSEEGTVMAAMLGYVIQELPLGRRVLGDFRTSAEIAELFERGVRLRERSAR